MTLVLIVRNKQVTENSVSPYVCAGCGTKFENLYNYCARYEPFEACPSCMTNEELYELEFGTKSNKGSD
jgi:hypothetical protein